MLGKTYKHCGPGKKKTDKMNFKTIKKQRGK